MRVSITPLFLSVNILACLGAIWWLSPETIYFTNDLAISLGVVELGEMPLAGPPSELFSRHLGPIYYIYLKFLLLIGGDYYGAIVLDAVIKISVGLFTGWFCLRRISSFIFYCGSLAAGYFTWASLISWHSSTQILFASFLICSIKLIDKKAKLGVSCTILSASLLAQLHLASLPMVLAAGILVLSRKVFPSIITILVTLITWIPTALYFYRFPEDLPVSGKGSNNLVTGSLSTLNTVIDLLLGSTIGIYYTSLSIVGISFLFILRTKNRLFYFYILSVGLYLGLFLLFRVQPRPYYLFSLVPLGCCVFSQNIDRRLLFLVVLPLLSIYQVSPLPVISKGESLAGAKVIVSELKDEPTCIRINKQGISGLRQNAYYLLSGRDWFFLFDQVHYFKELSWHKPLPECLIQSDSDIQVTCDDSESCVVVIPSPDA